LILFGAALLAMTGFELAQISQERDQLRERQKSQSQAVRQSDQVRTQLETIVRETKTLALAGNKNAQAIVAQLERQGFRVSRLDGSGSSEPGDP
jgi:hypothetical protein